MKYPVATEDEWFHIPRKGFRHGCCECSLIHDVDVKVDEQGRVWTRWRVNGRATAAARRWFNFEPEETPDD